MRYSRIVAEFYRRVWAIREETLLAMRDLLRLQSSGVKWSVEEIRERIEASNLASGLAEHESQKRVMSASSGPRSDSAHAGQQHVRGERRPHTPRRRAVWP